jgi:predicted dehydrogenase
LEQEAFIAAVTDSSVKPEVSAEEGLAAMECAEKILQSVKEHSWD